MEKEFVLTLGAGAMEHYLGDREAGAAPWVETMAAVDVQAQQLGSAGNVLARVYVNARTFRERFPEAMGKTMLGKMFDGLGFRGVDSGVLSARGQGRVISLDGATVAGGKIAVTPWTANLAADSALVELVPAEADAYVALRVQWAVVYERALALLDSMMTGPGEETVERRIADFAKGQGVDVRRDILNRKLQPVVMVHDAPRHIRCGLPLMVTRGGGDGTRGAGECGKGVGKSC